MNKNIQEIRRGPGRPKQNGRGLALLVRLHEPQIRSLDGWIAMGGEPISRPEALRRLAEMALETMRYPRNESAA